MKYTTEQLAKMRNMLATRDIEQSDDSILYDVFMGGCVGWGNFEDDFVAEQFEMNFGDDYFDEYEMVQTGPWGFEWVKK